MDNVGTAQYCWMRIKKGNFQVQKGDLVFVFRTVTVLAWPALLEDGNSLGDSSPGCSCSRTQGLEGVCADGEGCGWCKSVQHCTQDACDSVPSLKAFHAAASILLHPLWEWKHKLNVKLLFKMSFTRYGMK